VRQYSKLEQRLLNDFQQGLPLSPTPYADIASELGVYETTVLESLKRLQTEDVISRVGAVIRPNRLGASTLAAVAVPEEELETVAAKVNEFAEVNHNYERDHHFNLWFVVVAGDTESLQVTINEIEQVAGYRVLDLPMLQDYFIDLGFELRWT
jgi:DNA-binding Lrp family transcriptional regulator